MGRNIAEESSITSFWGGWLATFILLPFGIYLTKRATKGIGLVNFDTFSRPIKEFMNRFKKTKQPLGNDR